MPKVFIIWLHSNYEKVAKLALFLIKILSSFTLSSLSLTFPIHVRFPMNPLLGRHRPRLAPPPAGSKPPPHVLRGPSSESSSLPESLSRNSSCPRSRTKICLFSPEKSSTESGIVRFPMAVGAVRQTLCGSSVRICCLGNFSSSLS
jgi:hypothetical protein